MKIHIFLCDDNTQAECFQKELFGSRSPWVLKAVKAGDYCLLYNYTDGKNHPIYGIWKAVTDGNKNIDKNAWWGMYPYQVKVKLYSKEYQCVSRSSIENLVTNDEGRVVNIVTGYRAQELLQYYSNS